MISLKNNWLMNKFCSLHFCRYRSAVDILGAENARLLTEVNKILGEIQEAKALYDYQTAVLEHKNEELIEDCNDLSSRISVLCGEKAYLSDTNAKLESSNEDLLIQIDAMTKQHRKPKKSAKRIAKNREESRRPKTIHIETCYEPEGYKDE